MWLAPNKKPWAPSFPGGQHFIHVITIYCWGNSMRPVRLHWERTLAASWCLVTPDFTPHACSSCCSCSVSSHGSKSQPRVQLYAESMSPPSGLPTWAILRDLQLREV